MKKKRLKIKLVKQVGMMKRWSEGATETPDGPILHTCPWGERINEQNWLS